MLIREVVSSRWRGSAALALAGVGVAAGVMMSSATSLGVPALAVIEPSAPPMIPASLVAPEAPPPARAAAAPAPDCGNVASIGDAIDATTREGTEDGDVLGASVDGCTIAGWTAHVLVVSWDAGRHFTRIAFEQPEEEWLRPTIRAAADRVIVLKGDALGLIRRGGAAIAWRPLEPALVAPGDADRPYLEVAIGGRWTAIKNDEAHLLAVTGDDGATWRYVALPRHPVLRRELRVTDAGQLWLDEMTYREATIPEGETIAVIHHRRADGARWIQDDALAHRAGGWIYETPLEDDWGCGTSQRVIAIRGAERVVIARDVEALRNDVIVVANARGAYSQYGGALYRIQGPRATKVVDNPALPFGSAASLGQAKLVDALASDARIAGVDANGTLIASIDGRLVRWSARGGWRILWDADPR